ncbi:sodium ion-translocating decarboxylase subunit beta, partial [Salmonella enterica subsp. enterica serovar Newport]|nr:oxaloacetate decarboxylase subunit beta [Salmonella enterica subsp. enterica serovar Newport]ECF3655574.1 oxaloacetate decarboxylase subunit beta [Salmonella enterica subsp. enterica serovar Newport]ECP5072242.1 sodium ion-translocating decarboxylase subunit beta [Salmonella enterica subsp. enterica serovar Newport]EDM3408362.1 oxaloacetate decarboxylase subunit beta [Salmonella enterica subsp. enterica serovar Newport]EJD4773113.1 sodium ion-translocating decarboxylase subunit beta [Salmone
ETERKIRMVQLRTVSKREKILFPVVLLMLVALLLPDAAPLLGVIAFGIGTAAGVLMAKLLNLCSKNKINPLIGSAGVSAVPMAARVSNKVGLESDPQNFLLMHAMGPNVAGVIGSAIAAGVMLKYVLAM